MADTVGLVGWERVGASALWFLGLEKLPPRVYAAGTTGGRWNSKVMSARALFSFRPISLQKFSNMHESKRIVKNSPFNPYVPILQLQSIYWCPSYFTYPPSIPPVDFKTNPRHYTNFIWKKKKLQYLFTIINVLTHDWNSTITFNKISNNSLISNNTWVMFKFLDFFKSLLAVGMFNQDLYKVHALQLLALYLSHVPFPHAIYFVETGSLIPTEFPTFCI